MKELKLIHDYKDKEEYRISFNNLAKKVFGLDFEPWYQKGFWKENYIPYSLVDGDQIVSNVSINKMEMILEGEKKSVLQIGTVMTHPDYRKQGLSGRLMEYIIERYENEVDFIFLFANPTVYHFYPKFGFEVFQEHCFSTAVNISSNPKNAGIRRVSLTDKEDFDIINRLTSNRSPVSQTLGFQKDQYLQLFYILYVYGGNLYYLEEEDTLIIFQKEEEKLHFIDIIGEASLSFNSLIDRIASAETKEVIFHFTPDFKDIEINTKIYESDYRVFIKNPPCKMPKKFLFPTTSHA